MSAYTIFGQEYELAIEESFTGYRKALLSEDVQSLLSFAHKEIVKKGGGSAYYADELITQINMYRAGKLHLVNIEIQDIPKVIVSSSNIQAMVPYTRTLKKEDALFEEKNYFFVFSEDEGKNWSFTDMGKYDSRSIKFFIPDYNDRLNIYVNSISH